MEKYCGWGDWSHVKTQINVYFQAVLSLMMYFSIPVNGLMSYKNMHLVVMGQSRKRRPLSRRSQNLWAGTATTGEKEESCSGVSMISSLFSEHTLWFFSVILMLNLKGSTLLNAVPYCHMTVSLRADWKKLNVIIKTLWYQKSFQNQKFCIRETEDQIFRNFCCHLLKKKHTLSVNVSEGTRLSTLGTAPLWFHSWKLFFMCF